MSLRSRRTRLFALIYLLEPVPDSNLRRCLGPLDRLSLKVDLVALERGGLIGMSFEGGPYPRRVYSTSAGVAGTVRAAAP